jgi:glycosyltransferase involved in cell wall biosynthesis
MATPVHFSVVIPCFDCERTIGACVDSLLQQTRPPHEIILVDDRSGDRTAELLETYAARDRRIRAVSLTEKGYAGGARNVGKDLATGDVVVFFDSDVTVAHDYLSILDELYASHPEAIGFGGAVLNPNRSLLSHASHFLDMSEQLPIGRQRRITTQPTINLSYRRRAIRSHYFLEQRTAAEDSLFNTWVLRGGGHLLFDPRLVVYHHHPRTTLAAVARNERFYARGFVMSRRLHGLPGRILLDRKLLLLLVPRFWMILKRVAWSRFFFRFLLAAPLVFACEVLRTLEMAREDWRVDYSDPRSREPYLPPAETRLRYRHLTRTSACASS